MKKSLLALAFAVASMPLVFAAQPPANNGQTSTPTTKSTTVSKSSKTVNKHRKSHAKPAPKPTGSSASATPSK